MSLSQRPGRDRRMPWIVRNAYQRSHGVQENTVAQWVLESAIAVYVYQYTQICILEYSRPICKQALLCWCCASSCCVERALSPQTSPAGRLSRQSRAVACGEASWRGGGQSTRRPKGQSVDQFAAQMLKGPSGPKQQWTYMEPYSNSR